MRYSLRTLFILLTATAALLSIGGYAFRSDEYQSAAVSAIWYVPTGSAVQSAENWLLDREFHVAMIPGDLQENHFVCGTGFGLDSDYVRCLTTFRADTVKGQPVYASLCIAPLDESYSIIRIEFEGRFRGSRWHRARIAQGRDLVWRLREHAHRWLYSEALASGVPNPEIALRLAQFKPGTAYGTQFELEKHLAEYAAQTK